MSEEIMDGNNSLEGLPAKDLLKRFHILQGERVETYALFEEYVSMLYFFVSKTLGKSLLLLLVYKNALTF